MSLNWSEDDLQEYRRRRSLDSSVQIASKPVLIVDEPRKNENGIKQNSDTTGQSKYRNKKTEVDGILFDSKKEAAYYQKLKIMKHTGEIKGFDRQVEFELQPAFKKNGQAIRSIKYIADFVIYHHDGSIEIVDTKGCRTKEFELKRKMFEYRYQQYELRIV